MAIPIFYDARINVPNLDSFSLSAGKPARFMTLIQHYNYRDYNNSWLGKVTPITRAALLLVHKTDYVNGVFDGTILNGFELRDDRVPEACMWTIGSLLSAARFAINHPDRPVCSPTSGFHHAGYDFGGGYCTFNGLMVVAAKLIQENPSFKIAILDCDMHFGDGTQNIIDKHQALKSNILHLSSGNHFYGDRPKQEALEFQAWLHEAIADINTFKPNLVLYQAGADPHIKDPLGGYLDDEELRQRDQDVFDNIMAPIVYCHAGGYQKPKDGTIFTDPVLAIHRNTLKAAERSVKTRILKGLTS